MKTLPVSLDERSPAGRALRLQIGAALDSGLGAEVIATLKQRERVLTGEVLRGLAQSGGLLDAIVGRVKVVGGAERSAIACSSPLTVEKSR